MGRLILVLVIIIATVGYFRGWFEFSVRNQSDETAVTVKVDKNKFSKDLDSARDAVTDADAARQAKGRVEAIAVTEGTLVVASDSGQTLSFHVDGATAIRRAGADIPLDQLVEGEEVLVRFREDQGRRLASSVTVLSGTERGGSI